MRGPDHRADPTWHGNPAMTGDANGTFVALYHRYEGEIRRYCRRRLGPDDVEDAVLETFAVAWRRLDRSPPADSALPWLYAIAGNVVRNQRRSSFRRTRLKRKVGSLVGGHTPTPDTLVVQRAEDRIVHEALGALRPDDQEILRLRTWEDLDRNEIAKTLDISPEAVDMRINRALKRLERALSERGHVFGNRTVSERAGNQE